LALETGDSHPPLASGRFDRRFSVSPNRLSALHFHPSSFILEERFRPVSSVSVHRLEENVLQFARNDFVRISIDQTIGQALAQVQSSTISGRVVYFYVVDDDGRLKGVLPTRRLLLNPPETPIAEIMVRSLVTLSASATLLDACEMFILHRLLALPVVDADGRMVGVIDVELYTDEISDLARREESDDVFQLIGVRLAEVRDASIPAVFSRRFPWLLCNIGGGLACAVLAGAFQGILDRVITLALFIPVVLALAESVSIQSLTLTLQAQHGRRVSWGDFVKNLVREIPIGLLLGGGCGLLVAIAAWVWRGEGLVGLCILASIGISVTLATLIGLSVPSAMRAGRRDPRVASGPIVLAVTDLATLFVYLGLATWLL
jgi:magnesium transporter